MEISTVPADHDVRTSELELSREGAVIATLPVVGGRATIPVNFSFNPNFRHEARAFVNRGIEDLELISNHGSLRPAATEFTDTREVELQENGRPAVQDVAKVFDARPYVLLNQPTFVEGVASYSFTTVTGIVRDHVAPVPSVLILGQKVDVTQTGTGPDSLGPFEGAFSKQIVTGRQDQLVTATAANALGNVGWDGVWLHRNPDVEGNPVWPPSIEGLESVPRFAEAQPYAFRIEVKDRG